MSFSEITLDKVIVIVVALSCILSSVVMLGPRVLGKPLTQEEATEVSMNSSIVREAFTYPRGYMVTLEIEHWNTTYIASIKQEYAYMGEKNPYGFLPDDHGIWKLNWLISSTSILHWIDDLSGQIIAQEWRTYDRMIEEAEVIV